jgi:ABC-type lipoprotein export system ATPase subunit
LEPVVRLENVYKDYLADGETVHALSGVSAAFHAGEAVALMGRSGCGKSTLLHLAGAMDLPTKGSVWIDGAGTGRMDDRALTFVRRSKSGFVFQSFQLLHNLSVVENVELPLLLAGAADARAKARKRLIEVELDGLESRMPHQLSGGQMQRVAIARALVHSPKILLADEPIGNLDTATGQNILALLRSIADRGTAVVMATHSLESTAICDRVVRMRDGRIEC